MNYWFTSDLHFGHARVIQYCNRPFADVQEMDRALIDNWNAKVQRGDQVYIVGDVSFHRDVEVTKKILKQLNGQKFLVRGNHDRKIDETWCPEYFGWVKDLYTVKVHDQDVPGGTQRIVLCHYAFRVWDKSHWGSWHLYGHSHGTLKDDLSNKSFDVGTDCHNYYPISYEEVKAIMASHKAQVVDHHGAD